MVPIIVAIVTLALTILGLVIKLTSFTTEIRVWVEEMRGDRKLTRRIPVIEVRIETLEKHIGVRHRVAEELNGHDDSTY